MIGRRDVRKSGNQRGCARGVMANFYNQALRLGEGGILQIVGFEVGDIKEIQFSFFNVAGKIQVFDLRTIEVSREQAIAFNQRDA